MKKKAIVLLSGGVDSTTTLAIAKHEGFQPITLSFDYGQRHSVELQKAELISRQFKSLDHQVITINLFGGSALTGDLEVPKQRDETEITSRIPVTYVPARNTIFLSYCLAFAEVKGIGDFFIGVNAIDYSGYPDCRPEYIIAFERMANLATKTGVEGTIKYKVHAPLINLTKAEIIRKGLKLGVNYKMTHSCYDPDSNGLACGSCDSCLLRLRGFKEIGAKDPVAYKSCG